MHVNVPVELAALERMTTLQLRQKYEQVFQEACRSHNRVWLVKRIIWRIQANAYGELSERARQRAEELANDADLRIQSPRTSAPTPKPRRKGPELSGTVLTRVYKGITHHVTVSDAGYLYEGERYRSLSAVARKITGAHWNGRLFFGLAGGGR